MAARERVVNLRIKATDEYSAKVNAAKAALSGLATAQQKLGKFRTGLAADGLSKEIEALKAAYAEAAATSQRYAKTLADNSREQKLSAGELSELSETLTLTRNRMRETSAAIDEKTAALDRLQGRTKATFAAFSTNAAAMQAEAKAARESAAALAARENAATGAAARSGPALVDPLPANQTQARIGELKQAQAAIIATRSEYDRMRKSVGDLGRQMVQAEAPAENLVGEFERQKAALAGLRAEMAKQEAALTRLRQKSQEGYATFRVREIAANAKSDARNGTAPAAVAASGDWWERATARFNSAMSTANGREPLRPYEIQNLAYQFNDLATQIASGTSPMQAFSQQIGQIAQILPGLTLKIIRATPTIAAWAAVIIPVVQAMGRWREEMAMTAEFQTRLMATVDGNRYDPKGLADMVRDLEKVGIASTDAKEAVLSMMQDGISPQRMDTFMRAARDMSDVWGMEFPDALETVRTGFDGTYESLAKLDDQYNFLTAEQRANIRVQYEQGKATDATREALEIFTQKQQLAADNARGPWAEAMRNLGIAWRQLLDFLAQTGAVQVAINALNNIASVAVFATGKLSTMGSVAAQVIAGVQAQLSALNFGGIVDFKPIPGSGGAADLGEDEGRSTRVGKAPILGPSQAEVKKAAEARAKAEAEVRAAAMKAELAAWGEQAQQLNDLNAKAIQDKLAREEKFREEQQKIAEDQGKVLEQISADSDDRKFEASIAMQTELQQRIARAQREAEQNLANVGLGIDEKTKADIAETTTLLYEQEEARKALDKANKDGGGSAEDARKKKQRDLEEALNNLLEYRKQLLDQIEFHENRGETTQAQQIEGQIPAINEHIRTAIDNLRTFWEGFKGPEAQAALASLQNVELGLTDLGDQAVTTGEDMNEMLADSMLDGFDSLADSLAEGKTSFKDFGRVALEVLADVAREILQLILRQQILNALQQGGGANGGIGGLLSGLVGAAVGVPVFHGGGLVSSPAAFRPVSAALFRNADRFHAGGIPGLRAGETAAILKNDEEVLTRGDPRHRLNGGGASGSPSVNIKQVNVIDSADMLRQALAGEAGEKVLLNYIGRNPRAVRGALGI